MNPISQIDAAIRRYPAEHHISLTDLMSRFDAAADLIHSNPPLAVCLAKVAAFEIPEAESWVGRLIRKRRRKICSFMGFPGTESTVRILAKVAPEACNSALLGRVRLRLPAPCLFKLLSHMKRIGHAELEMAAHWKACPHMPRWLFLQILDETVEDLERLRTETENMRNRGRQALHALASVQRCHVRLGPAIDERESAKALLTEARRCEEQIEREVAALVFPPAPVKGTATIQPILNPKELLEEGRTQSHCAGFSHAKAIACGGLYFYRVLEPERATLSISRLVDSWNLNEIVGPGNSQVSNATLLAVEKWLAEAQGNVDDSGFVFRPRLAVKDWEREHSNDEYLY